MTDETTTADEGRSTFLIYLRGLPDPIKFEAQAKSVKVKSDGTLDWANADAGLADLVAVEPQEIAAIVEVHAGLEL